MVKSESQKDADLQKFIQRYSAGDSIFRQGEMGDTLFLIQNGIVDLYRESNQKTLLVATLHPGEVMGEKIIWTGKPYPRTGTARARTSCLLIEVGLRDVKTVKEHIPDFSEKILKTISNRLDQANEMIAILQKTSDFERIVEYLLYCCDHSVSDASGAHELGLQPADIAHAVNVDEERVKIILNELISKKLIQKKQTNYVIPEAKEIASRMFEVKREIGADQWQPSSFPASRPPVAKAK